MRRQVYKKVIEIAPDLKRQIAMEMGCTVDTVYNALNLSNPTTGAQPDRIDLLKAFFPVKRLARAAQLVVLTLETAHSGVHTPVHNGGVHLHTFRNPAAVILV